jgi:hypothetical protein
MNLCQVGHRSCVTFEEQGRAVAVIRETIWIAVDEVRPDFSQIAGSDRLIAHRTEALWMRRPAIDQYESHVAPPSAKQNTVSDVREAFGGGAQR